MLRLASSTEVAVDLSVTGEVALRRRGVVSWRAATGVGVVIAMLVCLLVVAGRHGATGVAATRSPAMLHREAEAARARREFVARERWLGSPAARAQRAASQTAFRGLSAVGAQRLVMHDYGRSLAADSVNPAATIARSGRVMRYLSNSRAVVATAHALRIVTSSVPLQVKGPGGAMAPLNLALTQSAKWLEPSRALAPVRIARDSSGGAVLGYNGVSIALVGRSVQGTLSGASTAFFANVGRDLDAAVVPKLSGADMLAVLRSSLSPRALRYVVRVPRGAVLRAVTGGAVILRGGAVLARISSPSAEDAQGSNVPVRMRVAGDALLVDVDTSNVAYPVLVDPEVWVQNLVETPEKNWTFTPSTSEGVHEEHSFPMGGPIKISSGGSFSGNVHENWEHYGGGEYRWKPFEGLEELTGIELLGVSPTDTGSESETKKRPRWGVSASVSLCAANFSDSKYPAISGEGREERNGLTSTM
jgi:hypothetical protein